MSVNLFTPSQLGSLTLPNRVSMAPLTRMRATMPGNVPSELDTRYYRQGGPDRHRATPVSPHGRGYFKTSGIHTEAQAKVWILVTRAVHEAEGHIFSSSGTLTASRIPTSNPAVYSPWHQAPLRATASRPCLRA